MIPGFGITTSQSLDLAEACSRFCNTPGAFQRFDPQEQYVQALRPQLERAPRVLLHRGKIRPSLKLPRLPQQIPYLCQLEIVAERHADSSRQSHELPGTATIELSRRDSIERIWRKRTCRTLFVEDVVREDCNIPQANFTWWIGDTYAGNFGIERSQRLNPFRSFLERGIQWAGGSDFFVTPFPARYGIWSSITREPLLGVYGKDAFGRDESVDARTALRSYTIWAAHQMFMEDKIGSIEIGQYADIAIWDVDLYSAEAEAIKNMNCQMTLLEGEIDYRAE